MHYLIVCWRDAAQLPQGCTVVADGEAMAFEQSWDFGPTMIVRVGDGANLDALKTMPGITAFTVEGSQQSLASARFPCRALRPALPSSIRSPIRGCSSNVHEFPR